MSTTLSVPSSSVKAKRLWPWWNSVSMLVTLAWPSWKFSGLKFWFVKAALIGAGIEPWYSSPQ
jgi:hypothetical protein